MKRILSLILVLLLAASIIGCGKKTDAPAEPEVTEAPTAQEPEAAAEPAQPTEEPAPQTDWPKKVVQIIVPYNAGGDTDLYARAVAKQLEKTLGQTFVIINTAGASGMTAAQDMLDAAPDGYTCLFTHTAKLTQEAVGLTDFSFVNDFVTGGNMVLDSTFMMIASAKGPYQTLEDVITASAAAPESVRYSQVYGSLAHCAAVQLEDAAGIKLKWLDVGSSNGDKIAALLSDQVDLIAVNYSTVKDYIANGDFVCLGIMSEERIPTLPEFPTFVEQGYNVVADKRYSFSFPKGTEDAIIAKLNEAFAVIAVDPEFIADVESYNGTVHYTNPEETYAYESATVERFRELFAKSTH